MKNIKTLTIGIIIGAVAALSITALAEYITTPNPYPVKVNGQEVQVEGYNINDSTYFKLRDVADAVGGFSVDFADNTIIVNTNRGEGVPTPTPVPTSTDTPGAEPVANAKATPNPKLGEDNVVFFTENGYEFTSDGLPIYVLDSGNKYVTTEYIKMVYNFEENGYEFAVGRICDSDYNVVLSDIQLASDNRPSHIEASYYEEILSSWLQENCK